MLPKTIHYFLRIAVFTVVTVLIASVLVFSWIATGPRSVSFLNDRIESILEGKLPGVNFHIGNTSLGWDNDRMLVDLRVKDVLLQDDKKNPIANIPELSLGITPLQVLEGIIEPQDLVIRSPALRITLPDTGSDAGREAFEASYKEFVSKMLAIAQIRIRKDSQNSFNIRDASIELQRDGQVLQLYIEQCYVTLSRQSQRLLVQSDIKANLEGKPIRADISLYFAEDNIIRTELGLHRFSTAILQEILPGIPALDALNLTTSANINFNLIRDASYPELTAITLRSMRGTFSHPVYFKTPFDIDMLSGRIYFADNMSRIVVDRLELGSEGAALVASGHITRKDGALNSIDLKAHSYNVPADHIKTYWPTNLGQAADSAHEWVAENILDGISPEAWIELHITPEDIANKYLAESSLKASIQAEHASLSYYPDMPIVTEARGIVRFTGKGMYIDATSGKMEQSTITKATVTIPDFHAGDDTHITVAGEATGPVADGIAFFDPTEVDKALGTPLKDITGTANTRVSISVPLRHDLVYDHIAMDIQSDIRDISLTNMLGKYSANGMKGNFVFNGKSVAIKADGTVNNVPVTTTITQNLPAYTQKFEGQYSVEGTLTPEQALRLSIPLPDNISGSAHVKAEYTVQPTAHNFTINADLTPIAFSNNRIGLTKQSGEALNIAVEGKRATSADSDIIISSIQSSSPLYQLQGSGLLSSDLSTLKQLDFSTLKFAGHDLTMDMDYRDNTVFMKLGGKRLNMQNIVLSSFSSSVETSSYGLDVGFDIGAVTMKNNVEFTQAKGQVTCSPIRCHTASLTTNLPRNGTLSLTMTPQDTQSALHIESNNAGALLRGFDFYENMRRGTLTVNATVSKPIPKEGNIIAGDLHIKDFKAVRTPILAKIITLGSLQGVSSFVSGDGIPFKRLKTPFTYKDNALEVKDLSAYGDALGFTAEGFIDTRKENIDLAGTVVPSYTVNNILGKIPLLGGVADALMGGKGQGILAVRYKIKGTYENADVSVNPLSILTPGFLRNLFNVIDSKPQAPKKDDEKAE